MAWCQQVEGRCLWMSTHAVILKFFDFGKRFWGSNDRDLGALFDLEDKLIEAITAADVGELDGNEIAVDGSDGFIFMYGLDARALFAAAEPVLRASPVAKGGEVTLRFGGANDATAAKETISLA
jgi:hypothetical protein